MAAAYSVGGVGFSAATWVRPIPQQKPANSSVFNKPHFTIAITYRHPPKLFRCTAVNMGVRLILLCSPPAQRLLQAQSLGVLRGLGCCLNPASSVQLGHCPWLQNLFSLCTDFSGATRTTAGSAHGHVALGLEPRTSQMLGLCSTACLFPCSSS